MKLTFEGIKDTAAWQSAGVKLPEYDVQAAAEKAKAHPVWAHFGAGNIFRIFVGGLADALIAKGEMDRGITCVETFDFDVVDQIYAPYDNLVLAVTLNADATTDKRVLGSLSEAIKAQSGVPETWNRLKAVFADPSLQMVSFTITEKGYALKNAAGAFFPFVQADIDNGPDKATGAMAIVCAMLLHRFENGKAPLAVVSMDNCSHNGEKLRGAVLTMADEWLKKGFVPQAFVDYISDEAQVAFPWSMIDKITPRPADSVCKELEKLGCEDIAPVITSKRTYIAPFVNAERPQYLVVEDRFPNGRPPLEKAGVYMTDRETVNKTERMKVTTCLNPLHTALAVYGCMLGYTLICDEMKDETLVKLVKRLGYVEGLPVVVDPVILSPKAFIDEVVEQRLPNPFMPDSPQRIATDTSQKVGIRFGETIKSYVEKGRDLHELTALSLAIAGWLRYLLGVGDDGKAIEISADPMKDELQAQLAGVEVGKPETYHGQIRPILANANIFGSDLTAIGMADRIEEMFVSELAGEGAVRKTLEAYLGEETVKLEERHCAETAREYALRMLKENIISMELKPGAMVSENELAAQLGLSRTPVREALMDMAQYGLVDILPQRGSRISLIDYALVEEARFAREVLEVAILSIVCENVTEESLAQLRQNVRFQQLSQEPGMSGTFDMMELDNEFHRLLFHIAHKDNTVRMLAGMMVHFDRVRALSLSVVKDQKIISDHLAICDAIERRDVAAAQAVMTKHLSRVNVDEATIRAACPEYIKN